MRAGGIDTHEAQHSKTAASEPPRNFTESSAWHGHYQRSGWQSSIAAAS